MDTHRPHQLAPAGTPRAEVRRDGEFGECKGGKEKKLEMIDRKKEKEERKKEQTAVRHEAG